MTPSRAPIPQDFPHLSTERLQLRPVEPSDIEDLLAFLGDPEVLRYYDIEPLTTQAELLATVRRWHERFEQGAGIRWAVALRQTGQVIGTCGLGFQLAHKKATLGYELARLYWRQRLMSEALRAVLQYAFQELQLHRIEALVMPDNVASTGLLKRLGFHQEGLLRHYYYFRGQHQDLLSFSLLDTDFDLSRRRASATD